METNSHRDQERIRHRKLVSQTLLAANMIPGLVENGKSRGTLGKTCKYLNEYLEFLTHFRNILSYESQSLKLSALTDKENSSLFNILGHTNMINKKIPSPQIEILNEDEPHFNQHLHINDSNNNPFNNLAYDSIYSQDIIDSGYIEMNSTIEALTNYQNGQSDIFYSLKTYKIKDD
ncbi:unnamed protein product [Gordionus sp. m RMFG-2023]